MARGCSLDSSSCAQTGNFFASNVIEFVTSCSSAQQRSFVLRPQHGGRARLSPTANRGAVVSCSGWPLIKSGHVTEDAGWLTDRQIRANRQQYGRAEEKVWNAVLVGSVPFLSSSPCAECLCRMCWEGLQSVGGRFLQPAEKRTTQKSDCDGGKQLFPKTPPRYVGHVTGITWLVLRGEFEGRPHFFGAVNAACCDNINRQKQRGAGKLLSTWVCIFVLGSAGVVFTLAWLGNLFVSVRFTSCHQRGDKRQWTHLESTSSTQQKEKKAFLKHDFRFTAEQFWCVFYFSPVSLNDSVQNSPEGSAILKHTRTQHKHFHTCSYAFCEMLKAIPQIIWLSTALYSASRDPGVCFSACVSLKHTCTSLSAAGSRFSKFPTGQDSLTSPIQSALHDAAKHARLQKMILQRVFAVHSGSITFRIYDIYIF